MNELARTSASGAVGSAGASAGGRWRGFESCHQLFDDAPVRVEGSLPAWLKGTLLLNGPALWDLPKGRFLHWFDGLAMMHGLRIAGGAVSYRNRWVDSEAWRESTRTGAMAFGEFGTPDPRSFLERMRSFGTPRLTDNPGVVMSRIGDRWVAQTETPRMMAFDPESLETLGPVRFDDGERLDLMSAHGMTDAAGVYWNVGARLGPSCTYSVFRIRPQSARREVLARIRVKQAGYLHAFALSSRHLLLWENALRAMPLSFLFTGRSYYRNFRWQPDGGSRIHAIDLADGAVRSWETGPIFCFHAIQAFERGGDLVLDLCEYGDSSVVDALTLQRLRSGTPIGIRPTIRRYLLPAGGGSARAETLPGSMDLPQVDPRIGGKADAGVAWGAESGAGAAFFDATLRLDLRSGDQRRWQRDDAVHLEPLFVPRPGGADQDDGVLLVSTLADDDESTVVGVIDARSMACLAMLRLPQIVPFGFHSAWQPG